MQIRIGLLKVMRLRGAWNWLLEMEREGKKWKELAKEAANEGGSSYNNLKAFVDEFGKGVKAKKLRRS